MKASLLVISFSVYHFYYYIIGLDSVNVTGYID